MKKTEKKTQKISVSYTLEQFKNVISKLYITEMISAEEVKVLEEIQHKAVSKYVKERFG